MTCYCADWCTGLLSCRDDQDSYTPEECQAACRCNGQAYMGRRNDVVDCNSGPGKLFCKIRFLLECTVGLIPPGIYEIEITIGQCSTRQGTAEQQCTAEFWFVHFFDDLNLFGCMKIPGTLQLIGATVSDAPIFRAECPSIQPEVPCCYGDNQCGVTTPNACVQLQGRFHEFSVWAGCTDNVGGNTPCNTGACCGDSTFDCTSNLPGGCRLNSAENCADLDPPGRRWRQPRSGGVGCHRPGLCQGQLLECDVIPNCKGGREKDDFAPTFRPEHHQPPLTKKWAEGFAEAVSINQQRPSFLVDDIEDCTYHYADAALVRETPRGDAFMLATCSTPQGLSFNQHVGPVIFRQDGYARFSVAYRAA